MKRLRVPLRVVFYLEEGRWVAHCLEFDLCGDATTQVEALEQLSQAISIQLRESREHGNVHNLISPAPGDVQEKFFAGKQPGEGKLSLLVEQVEHIEIGEPEFRVYADESDLVSA